MDQKQFISGFTAVVAAVGAGVTAAAFVPVLPNETFNLFRPVRNDFFLVPLPPSGTLTLAELTAQAPLGLPLVTLTTYSFFGAPRYALATSGAAATMIVLKGFAANTATFAIS